MAAAIGLRGDFDATALRALAKASRDPDQLVVCCLWRRFMMVARAAMLPGSGALVCRRFVTGFCGSTLLDRRV